MSLRSKIVLLLSAVVLAYAGLDHLMQRMVVFKSFVELERSVVQKDIARVNEGIQGEIDMLARECAGWATSESVRDGVSSTRSLPEELAANEALHIVCLCGPTGAIIASRVRDDLRGVDVVLSGFTPGDNLVPQGLVSSVLTPTPRKGILDTERSLLVVASEPVLQTTDAGSGSTVLGTLVVGRFLRSVSEDVASRVGVPFEAWSVGRGSLPEEMRAHLAEARASASPVLREVDEDRLHAYWCLDNLRGKPEVLMYAPFPRPITAKGSVAVRYALVSTIAAGLLLMLVLLNMVQRTVLEPLGQLTEHAVEIAQSEDFGKRIRSDREDEVGILAREFDGMIERVAESRAALVETARAAGMSEIATGVLHNIGNVLNSVNVSARIVVERTRSSATDDLQRVLDTLRPRADDLAAFIRDDPRGRHLFPLLDSLTEKLASERSLLTRELESLTEGIDHIKELVQSQQGYAGRAGVREVVSLSDLIETAISITSQATFVSAAIEVLRDYADIPSVSIDRHRLMEILVNLIQNARQSVTEARSSPMRITVRTKRLPLQRFRIEVVDNGVGIAPENLARVFTHGFTTKKNGHGFGLHASANAATEMGGTLTANSAGKGQGATFLLDLPMLVPATARVSA